MQGQTLGTLLARARKAKRLSRPALAVKMSAGLGLVIDQSYLSRIEVGKIARPAKDRLIWLEKFLGVPEGTFLQAADYGPEDTDGGAPANEIVPEVAGRVAALPAELQRQLLDFLPTLEKLAELMGAEPKPQPLTPRQATIQELINELNLESEEDLVGILADWRQRRDRGQKRRGVVALAVPITKTAGS